MQYIHISTKACEFDSCSWRDVLHTPSLDYFWFKTVRSTHEILLKVALHTRSQYILLYACIKSSPIYNSNKAN